MAFLPGLLALLVYWPATHCGFINFDDDLYVTANPRVQSGLTVESIKSAFLVPVASNWHPVTMLSHMMDCQLFGLNPWWPHTVNVLLHALNSALVFVLLREMTGAAWRSAAVAALFAVHPLHVESVAWVSERKDVLSTFFSLLSLIFYARYAQLEREKQSEVISKNHASFLRRRDVCYGLAFLFLLLGLMSKAMLVTWPFVMLLLDYWPLGRARPGHMKRLIIEKMPFFALVVAASIMTMAVQQHAGAVALGGQLPFSARCENALISYCRYLGMLFWPVNLAVFYPLPGHWPIVEILMAAIALTVISVVVLLLRKRYAFLAVGWFWFVGTLLPVIGLIQAGDQALADRYMYIPSIGFFVLIIWGVYEMTSRWKEQTMVLSIAGTVTAFLCISTTSQQLGYWKDSETLFRHALDVTTDNYVADNNLAVVLEARGEFDEAMSRLQEAIRLKPYDVPAIFNLGNVYYATVQYDEAISEYRDALRLDPNNPDIHLNLGNAFFKKKQFDDAIAQYQEVVRLDPGNALAHNNLGEMLAKKGQTDDAISQYLEAIGLKPDYAQAYNNLGYLLQNVGRIQDAIGQYQQALRINPDYALARNNLDKAEKMLKETASP